MVLPGVDDVIASLLCPVIILISDDFPTFERPINAYSGSLVLGHISALGLEITNLAVLICMIIYEIELTKSSMIINYTIKRLYFRFVY